MHRPRAVAAAIGVIVALTLSSVAVAHAELVFSAPAAGEVVVEVPAEIVLVFDKAVVGNSAFSVLAATGETLVTGRPDPTDATRMRAALPALEVGVYTVQWTSVGEDTGIERGTFNFTVAEPTPAPPTPTAAPTDAPTAAPAATLTATASATTASPAATGAGDGDTTGGADVLLPLAALGLLIGGGLAFFLRRRGAV